MAMSNPMQDLHTIGLNPFAVTLLAESMLKSAYVKHCGTKPLTFEFPVSRGDCAGWAGGRITIEAVPIADGVKVAPAADSEALVLAIREHLDGWSSATFGFQDDPDPMIAERNKQAAIQAHAAECLRRIRATLGVKEGGDA